MKTWLKKIEECLDSARASGQPFGACILPDPAGGPPICRQADEATCKNLGGTYLGGDCGAAEAMRAGQSSSYTAFLKGRSK